ncbi:MAG: hypothetical protein ACK5W7_04295 [Gemmatimonadaceae bacterium]|jgi:hypothetical protein
MTNDELTTLEALANAATPGPWVEDGFDCVRAPDFRILYDNSCRDDDNGARNAAFIAAARDAVPALVAEVRRLKEAYESAYQRGFDAGAAQLSRALKEVGKL